MEWSVARKTQLCNKAAEIFYMGQSIGKLIINYSFY